MKSTLTKLALIACIGIVSVVSTNPVYGQEGADDQAKMMEKWMEFATPGKEHERLKYKVGKWNFVNKMWMAPGAPPSETTGVTEYKMIMDGRYLEDHTKGSFQGQPFLGRGTTGYNNSKKKYITLWIDNMGTGFMVGEGTYDESKKTWEYIAHTTDPFTGEKATFRSTEQIIDDNSWKMTMYTKSPDGEFKTMEITYKRAK